MAFDGIMKGKRGLIMGVANDRSISWGIAKACADAGAELAFTYQGEALERRVKPLAESVGSKLLMLWLIDLLFGEAVLFSGPHHVLVFIVVVVAMLAAEEGVFRIYRSLGEREGNSTE